MSRHFERSSARHVLQMFAVIATAGPAGAIHAGEPADRGVSFSTWAGAAVDMTVTSADSGRSLHVAAPMFGVTGLGNLGPLAIGAAVDGTPAMLGDGRLSLSGLLGLQRQRGRMRVLILGEGGGHRFSEVGGALFARHFGPDVWLPYAGVRLGAARTVPLHGLLELGLWIFGRYDVGRKTFTNVNTVAGEATRTDYRVGGFMLGLAFQIGFRLEGPHPWRMARDPGT